MSYQSGSAYLRFAGDVNIEKAVIISSRGVFQDVSGQVTQVQIFEDIFSPFISGTLVLKDALDYTNIFPLIGEEYLDIRIATPTLPGNKIEGRFHIYKMAERTKLGDRVVAYQLNFISVESLIDTNKKTSKVYAGKISDLVPTFITDKEDGLESKKKYNIENTRNTIKYISPFWSPVRNLQFLADNSISENQSPSFLFFENRDGFNFRSLDRLYRGNSKIEFVDDRYTRDSYPGAGNSLNIMEDYKRMSNVEVPAMYDYMDKVRSGSLSSKLMSYDSTKKTYTVKNFDAKTRFAQQGHLNGKPLFTEKAPRKPNSRIILYPRAFETFTSFGDTTNARIIQERNSILKMAESQQLHITVPGRTDYTVGMVVNVLLQKQMPLQKKDSAKEITDKILSGRYLVTAINHIINPEGHECRMELSKDSLMD